MSAVPALLQNIGLDLTNWSGDPFIYRGLMLTSSPWNINIIAHVTVDEDHDDELVITEHPVEYGANISDHAYKRPAEVRIRMGWTQSGHIQRPQWGQVSMPQSVQDVRAVYEDLLQLQTVRTPFVVYTGKRTYQNMLVAGIRTHTDAKLEYSLIAEVWLREVILAQTQNVSGTNLPTNQAQYAAPQSNAPTQDQGQLVAPQISQTANQISQMGGTP